MKSVTSVMAFILLFCLADNSFAYRPLTAATIKNNTGVTLTVWAEYYSDHSLDYSKKTITNEIEIPPGGYHDLGVPVGIITLHAEARGYKNPRTGKYYKTKKSFQRNNPGVDQNPNSIYWGVTYEALNMDPSIRDPKVKSFSGMWECGKAILNIRQNGSNLEGHISGNANDHIWIKNKGGGKISGDVKGKNKADIYIEFPDGYYMAGKNFTLRNEGDYMSGLDPIFTPAGNYSSGGAVVLRCNRM